MDVSKYVGSVFLKVDDIKASSRRVTIVDVVEGRFGKLDLHFDDGTCLSCNATNSRMLARAYGMDSDDWTDKQVELVVGEIKSDGKMNEAILVKPISPPIENKAPASRRWRTSTRSPCNDTSFQFKTLPDFFVPWTVLPDTRVGQAPEQDVFSLIAPRHHHKLPLAVEDRARSGARGQRQLPQGACPFHGAWRILKVAVQLCA